MTDPQNMDEYLARYQQHERIFGTGMETSMSAPCPFCCTPDFWVYRVIDVEATITKEKICANCQRGVITLYHRSTNGSSFEIVQTTGPDQPAWLFPKMRRLTAEERHHHAG